MSKLLLKHYDGGHLFIAHINSFLSYRGENGRSEWSVSLLNGELYVVKSGYAELKEGREIIHKYGEQ